MTTLDLFIVGVLAVSAVLGLMRGFIRELFSLGAWVLAFLFAKSLAPFFAPVIPGIDSETMRYLLAIVLVFICILVLATLSGTILAGMVKWVGLGFYDKFLGLIFGILRGGVIVLLFTLLAGLTALPRSEFWQSARLSGQLEVLAERVIPWLPASLAQHIQY